MTANTAKIPMRLKYKERRKLTHSLKYCSAKNSDRRDAEATKGKR